MDENYELPCDRCGNKATGYAYGVPACDRCYDAVYDYTRHGDD